MADLISCNREWRRRTGGGGGGGGQLLPVEAHRKQNKKDR